MANADQRAPQRPLNSDNDPIKVLPSSGNGAADPTTDEKKNLKNEPGDVTIELESVHPDDPSDKSQPKQNKTGGFIANLGRLLSYATGSDWILIITAVLCSAGAGIALPLMNVVVFGRLSANFTGYFVPGSGITKTEFLSQVNHNTLYIVYLFIGKFVLDYASMFAFRMAGIRISASIRRAYLSALLRQPISVVDKLPPGSATDSLTTAANTIQMGISDKMGLLIQSFALLISSYVIAFKWSWKLTLASSSCIVFVVVFYSAILPFWYKLYKDVIRNNAKAAGTAGEALSSIRTVKALCAEEAMIKRHAEWISRAKRKGVQMSPLTAAQFAPGKPP